MLTRAFTKSKRGGKGSQCGSNNAYSTRELYYHDDYSMAEWYMDEQSLVFCDRIRHDEECGTVFGSHPTLRDVLRSAVAVMGESCMGLTEKVVLVQGKIYAMKRFKKVSIGKTRFGKRAERLAQVSRGCEYLVPVEAYLYSKRVKIVMHEHFPMGSLADLLAGERKEHTALNWPQRLNIIRHLVAAISYIHNQNPRCIKSMQMNVHGNIKSSNVMIREDFSACLQEYGFTHLASPDIEQNPMPRFHKKISPPPGDNQELDIRNSYYQKASQAKDMYDFGVLVLDMLAGTEALKKVHSIKTNMDDITYGRLEFFEFAMNPKQRNQALVILYEALSCVDELPEARPSINRLYPIDTLLRNQLKSKYQ